MNGKAKYEFIDDSMLDAACAEGRRSPRLRMNRNFHRSTDEAVNRLLNAMTAEATGLKVFAGPAEATAIGNILLQAITARQISSKEQVTDIRQL